MTGDRRARAPVPGPLGAMFEPLYRRVIRRRNGAFDRGRRVRRVPVPVISIGNLSVGGTGKTPVVSAVAGMLAGQGHRPGIAMRGYRARPGEPSDEQLEHARTSPAVPVAAMPDRVAGAEHLIREHNCTCILLDDGFQHRFLHRDLDIVLLDATRPVFQDRCLPAGWLREPVESLGRAHAIVLTHAESVDGEALRRCEQRIRDLFPSVPIAIVEHAWSALRDADHREHSFDELRGATFTLTSGIGNPTAFQRMAQQHGLTVHAHQILPDHHAWTIADLDDLAAVSGDTPILTTRKDWVKIDRLDHPLRDRFRIADVSIRFRTGEETLRSLVLTAAG